MQLGGLVGLCRRALCLAGGPAPPGVDLKEGQGRPDVPSAGGFRGCPTTPTTHLRADRLYVFYFIDTFTSNFYWIFDLLEYRKE